MTRYPTTVLMSLGIVAGFTLACAHGRGASHSSARPAPAPPATMVPARESAGSLEQMLAGRIAGVSVVGLPGGGISVLIRGPTSFYSSNEPLYVVDDVPVDAGRNGSLSWLRPEDIASIAVLRDAAAAIYGVRGANGVVVIRTKGSH